MNPRPIISCSQCGGPSEFATGQEIVDGKLVWWASFNCNSCGDQTELDGSDIPPTEFRNAILKREGTWELRIEPSQDIPRVAKALRRIFSLSLAEAMTTARKIPNAVASGTRMEMEHAREQLAAENIPSKTAALPQNEDPPASPMT